MPRRSYHQSCPLARALDAVGERWTLLVVRELLLGPRHYGEIRERLPGIGTNLLADRLKSLERLGLTERLPENRGHRWALTAAGRGLEPALMEIIRWAMTTRLPSRSDDISRPEWDLVAMTALFRAPVNGAADGRYQLVLNGFDATLTVDGGRLEVKFGPMDGPDAVVEMDSVTGWMLATRCLTPADATKAGRLRIRGDQARAGHLLHCFQAP